MIFSTREELKEIVLNDLKTRTQNAELKIEKTRAKLLENAEYSQNYYNRKKLLREIGFAEYKKQDTTFLRQELKKVETKLDEFEKLNNLTEDDFKVKYLCENCQDTGYDKDGKECQCLNRYITKLLMSQSNIELENIDYLEDIDAKYYGTESSEKILNILKNFAKKIDETKITNIVLGGKSGVGKTYLTKALAKSLLKKNYSVLFISAFSLNDVFKKAFLSGYEKEDDILAPVFDCDVLIIDDLGVEQVYNKITREYMYKLFDYRMSKNKKIIISTNLLKDEIDLKYDMRVYSRMFEKQKSFYCFLDGKDKRINN